MTPDVYTFHRKARNWATLLTLLGTWVALILVWTIFDASGWIVGFVFLFTLPAVYDVGRNPSAGLSLDRRTLRWYSGRTEGLLDLDEIDHMRLDTRMDFSVRATAILHTGRKIRLPFEATPPHKPFEAALIDCGVKTQRHHFSLMQ